MCARVPSEGPLPKFEQMLLPEMRTSILLDYFDRLTSRSTRVSVGLLQVLYYAHNVTPWVSTISQLFFLILFFNLNNILTNSIFTV